MIKTDITEEDRKICGYERKHHIHPRVRQKTDVPHLKINGLPHKKIAETAGVSENTVPTYLKQYQEGGSEKSREINSNKPVSGMTRHISAVEAYFGEHPPAPIGEAAEKIEELTGLERSETQVCKFLKSAGFGYGKVGTVPAEADIVKQKNFIKQEFGPRIKEAVQGKRKIFLLTQVILSLPLFQAISGHRFGYLSKHRQEEKDSMYQAHLMLLGFVKK